MVKIKRSNAVLKVKQEDGMKLVDVKADKSVAAFNAEEKPLNGDAVSEAVAKCIAEKSASVAVKKSDRLTLTGRTLKKRKSRDQKRGSPLSSKRSGKRKREVIASDEQIESEPPEKDALLVNVVDASENEGSTTKRRKTVVSKKKRESVPSPGSESKTHHNAKTAKGTLSIKKENKLEGKNMSATSAGEDGKSKTTNKKNIRTLEALVSKENSSKKSVKKPPNKTVEGVRLSKQDANKLATDGITEEASETVHATEIKVEKNGSKKSGRSRSPVRKDDKLGMEDISARVSSPEKNYDMPQNEKSARGRPSLKNENKIASGKTQERLSSTKKVGRKPKNEMTVTPSAKNNESINVKDSAKKRGTSPDNEKSEKHNLSIKDSKPTGTKRARSTSSSKQSGSKMQKTEPTNAKTPGSIRASKERKTKPDKERSVGRSPSVKKSDNPANLKTVGRRTSSKTQSGKPGNRRSTSGSLRVKNGNKLESKKLKRASSSSRSGRKLQSGRSLTRRASVKPERKPASKKTTAKRRSSARNIKKIGKNSKTTKPKSAGRKRTSSKRRK